jgi:phosphoglycolate phosphatase
MVGDRKHDIIGAKENGLKCVAVLYGYGSRGEFEEYGADFIAATPDEAAEIVLR